MMHVGVCAGCTVSYTETQTSVMGRIMCFDICRYNGSPYATHVSELCSYALPDVPFSFRARLTLLGPNRHLVLVQVRGRREREGGCGWGRLTLTMAQTVSRAWDFTQSDRVDTVR